MKIAFYRGPKSGILEAVVPAVIRWRLRGPYSHCEIVFEAHDGVEELMPDALLQSGYHWCASSDAFDTIPLWSRRRPGKAGGVRFKQIRLDSDEWDVIEVPTADAYEVAWWFKSNEGHKYDWKQILGFLSWFIPQQAKRWTCSEACCAALGIDEQEAWRFDPVAVKSLILYGNPQQ